MEQTRQEDWTYLGIVLVGKDQRRFAFERPSGAVTFKKNIIPSWGNPGSIWKVTIVGEGETTSVRTQGDDRPAPNGMVDAERATHLQAVSRAAEVEFRMQKKAKADMSDSELSKLLEPLREEYARRNRVGKAALLATIYEQIGLI